LQFLDLILKGKEIFPEVAGTDIQIENGKFNVLEI
jgi:hypothetical protein